jgi:hypothetical protein
VLTLFKGLIPLLVVLLTNGILPKLASLPTHDSHDDAAKEASDTDPQLQNYSSVFLFLITGSATTALLAYTLPATIVLGLSSAIFTAVGFVLLERATRGIEDDDTSGIYEPMPVTGTQTGRGRNRTTPTVSQLSVLRDASATLAMICVLASMSMEPSIYNIYREPPSRKHQQHWTKGHDSAILQRIAWMVPVNVMTNALMYIIVSQLASQLLVEQNVFQAMSFTSSLSLLDLTICSFLSKERYIHLFTSYLLSYSPKYTFRSLSSALYSQPSSV